MPPGLGPPFSGGQPLQSGPLNAHGGQLLARSLTTLPQARAQPAPQLTARSASLPLAKPPAASLLSAAPGRDEALPAPAPYTETYMGIPEVAPRPHGDPEHALSMLAESVQLQERQQARAAAAAPPRAEVHVLLPRRPHALLVTCACSKTVGDLLQWLCRQGYLGAPEATVHMIGAEGKEPQALDRDDDIDSVATLAARRYDDAVVLTVQPCEGGND